MEMIWLLLGFFAFVTIAFIAFAYFFPEWIGITGAKAKEIQKHQEQDSDDQSVLQSEETSDQKPKLT